MKPPSPPSLPLIGHIPGFRRNVLGLLIRSVEEYGDHIRFKLGPHPVYVFNHPDDAHHVLKKNASNYDKETRSTRFLRDIADESLLTSNGKQWQKRRQHLQPAFHRKAIVGFETIMQEEAQALLESWEQQTQVNHHLPHRCPRSLRRQYPPRHPDLACRTHRPITNRILHSARQPHRLQVASIYRIQTPTR